MAKDLDTAADLVEAIDGAERRFGHCWNLQGWSYQLVPWGVRFTHHDVCRNIRIDVIVRLAGPIPFRPSTMTLFTRESDAQFYRRWESTIIAGRTD